MIFCNNASCDTQRMAEKCVKACSGQGGQINNTKMPTYYQQIQTQQSQRNPSSYQNTNNYPSYRQDRIKTQHNPLHIINQLSSMQVINQNNKQQNQQFKAINRNRRIAALLSTVIAFSQRVQSIKQKLAGYPGQSFSPVEFFNVLDLTQKGFVDVYDIKRFVSNERISQKDILSLFKRVNGDHSKDNNKLSYFGYLNLIKPYFNQMLARDLLLRDAGRGIKSRRKSERESEWGGVNEIIQPTQQSVLLLFQQLILLQCICTSEHQQAKQDLMNSYMLNVLQLKQLIGLQQPPHLTPTHKTPLRILFQFIQNSSQYQIDFAEMKYLLSYLNAHEFSLQNQKYLSMLFIPMNIKAELMKYFQGQKTSGYSRKNVKSVENYMRTYLTKENLINKGNIMPIKQYIQSGLLAQQQLAQHHNLTQHHMALATSNNSKANFLEFVHPKSLHRMSAENNNNLAGYNNGIIVNNNNNAPQFTVENGSEQQQLLQQHYYQNEHPQMQIINPSNKYLSKNQSRMQMLTANQDPSHRQYSNPSSIPQQNIQIHPPRQPSYLKKQPDYQQVNTSSIVSHTPFLQKFMKQNNNLPTATKNNYPQTNKHILHDNDYVKQKTYQSKLSDNSAFEVVDYGYEPNRQNKGRVNDERMLGRSRKNGGGSQYQQQVIGQKQRYGGESQRFRKESLDSRYNLVINQYKNNHTQYAQPNKKPANLKPSQLYNQQSSSQYQNYGPKFQKSVKISNIPPVRHQYSNGNYIDSVGLSQSNMVEESQFINRFYQNGGNILSEFLKKV